MTIELNMRLNVRGIHLSEGAMRNQQERALEFLGRYGRVEHRCKQVWSRPTVYRLTVKVYARNISVKDLYQLSVLLKQECVSVFYPAKGVGKLVGPKAKEWGAFDLKEFDRIDFPLPPKGTITVPKVYVPDEDSAVEKRKMAALSLRTRQVFTDDLLENFAPQQFRLTNSAVDRVLESDGPDALTVERLEGIYELVTEHWWCSALTTALKSQVSAPAPSENPFDGSGPTTAEIERAVQAVQEHHHGKGSQ